MTLACLYSMMMQLPNCNAQTKIFKLEKKIKILLIRSLYSRPLVEYLFTLIIHEFYNKLGNCNSKLVE